MQLIPHFKPVHVFILSKGSTVTVKLAGWGNTVSRKRMSASPVHAKTAAPVWIVTMATPVSAILDSEVIITLIVIVIMFLIFHKKKKSTYLNHLLLSHQV